MAAAKKTQEKKDKVTVERTLTVELSPAGDFAKVVFEKRGDVVEAIPYEKGYARGTFDRACSSVTTSISALKEVVEILEAG